MTDYISSKEFVRFAKGISDNVLEMRADNKELIRSHQKFITAQTKINTEQSCGIKEIKHTHQKYEKVALLLFAGFISLAGIGSYTVLTPEQEEKQEEKPEERPVLVVNE